MFELDNSNDFCYLQKTPEASSKAQEEPGTSGDAPEPGPVMSTYVPEDVSAQPNTGIVLEFMSAALDDLSVPSRSAAAATSFWETHSLPL